MKLSPAARLAIANPESTVLVSAASAWEIAIKQRAGKFRVPDLVKDFQGRLQQEGFVELPISIEHSVRAGALPGSHKDLFDRVLIAQSQVENAAMVSAIVCSASTRFNASGKGSYNLSFGECSLLFVANSFE